MKQNRIKIICFVLLCFVFGARVITITWRNFNWKKKNKNQIRIQIERETETEKQK